MGGYHKREIPRGKFKEFSKIKEEFLEALDAYEEENPIMLLTELADLVGAIEGFCESKHNVTLQDLITMKDATARAFKDGTRENKSKK